MTEVRYLQAMREEVDLAELYKFPIRERYQDGYAINSGRVDLALTEIKRAGKDYRVQLWATNGDGDRYQVFINEGRANGIGSDGLIEMLGREGLSLSQAIEKYTFGLVPANDIAFLQMEFRQEHHR